MSQQIVLCLEMDPSLRLIIAISTAPVSCDGSVAMAACRVLTQAGPEDTFCRPNGRLLSFCLFLCLLEKERRQVREAKAEDKCVAMEIKCAWLGLPDVSHWSALPLLLPLFQVPTWCPTSSSSSSSAFPCSSWSWPWVRGSGAAASGCGTMCTPSSAASGSPA